MNRLVTWILGALAIGTAARAVVRPVHTPHDAPAAAASDTTRRSATAGDSRVANFVASESVVEAKGFVAALTGRFKAHATPLLAGALSYYAFLAIFPAAIATVSIYALVQDPAGLQKQISDISAALPSDAASIITKQLEDLVLDGDGAGLGVGAVISIVAALWAASSGIQALMKGINQAYDATEGRKFVVLRSLALLLTLGAIVFLVTAISSVTFLPDLLQNIGLGDETARAIELLRWPGLFVAVVLALGILYKVAPNRPAHLQRLISWGAIIASGLWLLATLGFSVYVSQFGNFNETYGALGGVIVLLLWFYLSGFMVLLGAEVNSEIEHRRHDMERVT